MNNMLWEKHWRYCRLLEQELDELRVYIDFDPLNFQCFSIKLLRLINSAMSEFEVVSKEICANIDCNINADKLKINQIRDIILKEFPDLIQSEVKVLDMNYSFHPFTGWDQKPRLDWWDSYNSLKHDRNNNFNKANLLQAIKSVAVLKVMVMILRKYSSTWMPATTWTILQVQENW